MDTDILVVLLVWLTIGVVIGGWISIDTFTRKVKGAKWVAAGIFLTVIGLALYLWVRDKTVRAGQPAVPTYRYSEPAVPEVRPAPMTDTTVEPAPSMPPATPEQQTPVPEPEGSRPEYRSAVPVREQVEGIPRCPKCDAAVSASDEFCSECGTKLK
jgi:zinc-ribbon domain